MEENNILQHSPQALRVLNEFYDKDVVIFIEGVTDRIFWSILLDKYCDKSYELIEVYGTENLDNYMIELIRNDLPIAVIADRDYREYGNNLYFHQRIIYSEGYSIENTLISQDIVENVIFMKSHGRYPSRKFEDILEHFLVKCKPLILLDIVNHVKMTGIDVMTDTCLSVISGDSCNISDAKLLGRIEKCKTIMDEYAEFISSISLGNLKMTVKGKWLLAFVRNFVIQECEDLKKEEQEKYFRLIKPVDTIKHKMPRIRVNISNDDLFTMLLYGLKHMMLEGKDLSYYADALSAI